MLKEGKYCEILNEDALALALLKVYGNKSHNLKIIATDFKTGEFKCVELHSDGEVKSLYQFLKKHFEGEDGERFSHKDYLEFVAAMKSENCTENEIPSEVQWRKELEAEFGDGD
ncbi:hypothetical protein [Ruminiclostridium hungatei]|nr:hypothetical protein [Ruminiclostridium hungatei]